MRLAHVCSLAMFLFVAPLFAVAADSPKAGETKTGGSSNASDPELAQKLRTVFQAHLDAAQQRDLRGALASVHARSPIFAATAQVLKKAFDTFELKFAIVDFKYVGMADGYAVCKVVYRTTRAAGAAFRDNISTDLCVFKREADEWKIWQQTTLEVQVLPTATAPDRSDKSGKGK